MDSEKLGEAKPAVEIPVEDSWITATLVHLNVDEAALPAFRGTLSYFATMQTAMKKRLAAVFSRENLTKTMLDNSGERDSHFIVVLNVL
ncbi:MAG: hypothetical protein LBB80_01325 [Treponema sp.]|jgi:hypothetical protein|nr:hypothetical protein [Treponema sp.]